jgi:hypothetical protein
MTDDDDTGIRYLPAPKGFENCVTLAADSITIPSHAIGNVPIRVVMPQNIKGFPQRFEFDIHVRQLKEDNVTVRAFFRFLINTR